MQVRSFKKTVMAVVMSMAVVCSMIIKIPKVSASEETFEYEGTTQIQSTDYYPEFATSNVSLTVGEVYAEAGSSVREGDAILKLTEDSYQNALSYYQAAIIRAQNNLLNEELSYTQGMQSAEYELELALADEEQASFVQEQSEAELNDTIDEHEEVLSDIKERIRALEDGEYDEANENESAVSSGSSGMSGSIASARASSGGSYDSSGSASDGSQSLELISESELTDAQFEQTDMKPGSSAGETDYSDITDFTGDSDIGTDSEEALKETSGEGSAQAGLKEQIAVIEEQIEVLESEEEELENILAEYQAAEEKLEKNIKEKDEEYNTVLTRIYTLLLQDEYDESVFCGAGYFTLDGLANLVEMNVTKTGTAMESEDEPDGETLTETPESETNQTEASQTEAPKSEMNQTETSQTEASASETTQTEAQQTEDPQTEAPEAPKGETDQTEEIVGETEASQENPTDNQQDDNSGKKDKSSSASTEDSDKNDNQDKKKDSDDNDDSDGNEEPADGLEDLICQLYEKEACRQQLYLDYYDLIYEKEETEQDLTDKQEHIRTLEQQITELSMLSEEIQIAALEQQLSAYLEASGETQSGEANPTENSEAADSYVQTDISEQSGLSGLTDVSGLSGLTDVSGLSGLTDISGLSGLSGLTDSSGLSGLSDLSGLTDISDVTQQMTGGGTASGTGSGQLSASIQGMFSTQGSTAMLSSTYDLTEAKALLERTATDADEAEELLEELCSMEETVQLSYEELLRKQTPLELEIRYQYDSTIRSARLAEITYAQTTKELEEELQSAQKNLSDLEDALQELENLGDGTVTAAASGTLSAVNYSAGDTLMSVFPIYSVYNTDTATIRIVVPQSEIAQISVGDSVEVQLSGLGTMEGTVTEKAVEAQEGTSRTTVNYEVEVSINNSSGWIGAGTVATVTVTAV